MLSISHKAYDTELGHTPTPSPKPPWHPAPNDVVAVEFSYALQDLFLLDRVFPMPSRTP